MNEVLQRVEGQSDAYQIQNPVGLQIHRRGPGREHGHNRAIDRSSAAFTRRMTGVDFDTVCGFPYRKGASVRHRNSVSHLDNSK